MQVYTKCSNYASDTCPCELAESGKCIVCSLNRGEEFCDCSDTVSYCIEQELINNGRKAKPQHTDIIGKVMTVKSYEGGLRFIRFKVPDMTPFKNRDVGTYIFMRLNDNPIYDVPLSIIYDEHDVKSLAVLIKIRGVKTTKFKDIKKGDDIIIRGPYYNGVMGRKHIMQLHNSKAYVFCKGIGFMPSIHVIEELRWNKNEVKIFLDEGNFSKRLIKAFSIIYEIDVTELKMCDESGNLTEEFKSAIRGANDFGCHLVHLGLSDYLIGKSLDILEDAQYDSFVSCINNAHLCCGEGVCGSCTTDIGAEHTVHLCKKQLSVDEMKMLI